MKKLIWGSVFTVLTFVVLMGGSSFNKHHNLVFSNVEALATTETSDVCKWKTEELIDETWIAFCAKSGVGNECSCGDEKRYPKQEY